MLLRALTLLLVLPAWSFAQQGITVRGRVTEAGHDTGLPDVSVQVKGTNNGTSTDENGVYTLQDVSPGATLVFSSVGYSPMEVAVQNRQTVDVALTAEVSDLEEVVVVGYGTMRKRDVTGAVSSLSAATIQNEAPTQLTDALRGNIAGLNVGFNARAKGGGSLQIRGRTSLNAGTSPLPVYVHRYVPPRRLFGIRATLSTCELRLRGPCLDVQRGAVFQQ
ncbi:TonB-dependent Receptor Plug Domain [Parapedobacter composti]|uniref:TonB-dependent Receptor Plug Domain n=1 Tax=Parapedobacter composti TaxID=623281 RepID=A0A1I1J7V5_9SPHI|nr:TonB-dependent Receptor Plug Domain [Parapedobacter composti]